MRFIPSTVDVIWLGKYVRVIAPSHVVDEMYESNIKKNTVSLSLNLAQDRYEPSMDQKF
jgi:hypothetical protein